MKPWHLPSGRQRGIPFLLPDDCTPEQALAVVELLDDLRERIWAHYQIPLQDLVREQEGSDSAMFAAAKLREVYLSKLKETRNKLAELRALEAELEASLDYLAGCDSACAEELPVHSCPSCELTSDEAPELVAGVHVN